MQYKILVDITHPAHVHFFRNAIEQWKLEGWEVLITTRDKDIAIELLDEYGYEYSCLGKAKRGVSGLFSELIDREGKFLKIIQTFKPDAICSIGGTFNVHAAWLKGIPDVIFYDTENAVVSNIISYPFATAICTPVAYNKNAGPKQVRYEGYHELAYLHPNWFTPDPNVLVEAGLKPEEPFSIVRFVGWTSGHDINLHGFSEQGKEKLISLLEEHGKVIISSEAPLPPSLEKYRLRIPSNKIHHMLAYANILVGESATMASEAVQLGVPAIYVSPVGRGYTDEQETKYDMCYTFQKEEDALVKCRDLLARENFKNEWQQKRQKLLSEKIDVTSWMVRFMKQIIETKGNLNKIEFEPGTYCQR